jgi:hypothetical protein
VLLREHDSARAGSSAVMPSEGARESADVLARGILAGSICDLLEPEALNTAKHARHQQRRRARSCCGVTPGRRATIPGPAAHANVVVPRRRITAHWL